MQPVRQQNDPLSHNKRSLWVGSPWYFSGSTRLPSTQILPPALSSTLSALPFILKTCHIVMAKMMLQLQGLVLIQQLSKWREEVWNISQKLQRGVAHMIYWAGLGHGSILRAITDMESQTWENWLKANHHSFPGNRRKNIRSFFVRKRGRAINSVPFE